jgi:hypothetical protein
MNRRTVLTLLASAAFALSPASAADQAMLRAVMPDAVVVAGADVDRIMSSPFGQFMLDRLRAEEENLQKVIEMTGFDPRRDLREVMLASRAPQGKGSGLVMARGTFDVGKLTATASTHGAVLDSYQEMVALLSGLVLAGPEADVRAALDRLQASTATSAPITVQANTASMQWDVWGVSTGSPAQFAGAIKNPNVGGALKGDVLQGITQTSGGVRFGANVEVGGEAVMRSAQDATALVDVYKFLMSMVQMNAPKAGPASSQLQSFLGSMNVTTSGNVVKFTAQLPEAELEQLINGGRRTTAQVHRQLHRQ